MILCITSDSNLDSEFGKISFKILIDIFIIFVYNKNKQNAYRS